MKTVLSQARTTSPVFQTGELARLTPGAPIRDTESRAINHIVVPIDFSSHSRTALAYALKLAAQTGAKVTLLHVMEQLPYQGEWMSPLQESDFTPSTQHLAEELKDWAPDCELTREPVVRIGRAPEEIVAATKDIGGDAIVMATHGYTGMKYMQLGSVAEYVVRHATCPVTLIRVMDAAQREYECAN